MVTKSAIGKEKSRFARLRDEARAKYRAPEPYVIDTDFLDDTPIDPPVVINMPVSYREVLDMAAVQDSDAGAESNGMAVLEHLCAEGDYQRLSDLLDKWPAGFVKEVVADIFDHLSEQHNWADDDVDAIPGKG